MFLTGIILYTFIQFHSTPAIVTSVFIGLAIIFCGCAMVHNVFIWQREKTNAVRELTLQSQHYSPAANSTVNALNIPVGLSYLHDKGRETSGSVSPANALDMSSVATTNSPHELSTLV